MVTSRTLVIMRHAKAGNPDDAGHRDRDKGRPLARRGQADAVAAGQWLVDQGLTPDLVFCSPARRTKETWHGVALALADAPTVRYEEAIYLGSARSLLALVRSAADDAEIVLLIGHNPGCSLLSSTLDPDPAAADADGLKTAGIAVHAWDGAWADCGPGAAPRTRAHTARS